MCGGREQEVQQQVQEGQAALKGQRVEAAELEAQQRTAQQALARSKKELDSISERSAQHHQVHELLISRELLACQRVTAGDAHELFRPVPDDDMRAYALQAVAEMKELLHQQQQALLQAQHEEEQAADEARRAKYSAQLAATELQSFQDKLLQVGAKPFAQLAAAKLLSFQDKLLQVGAKRSAQLAA